MTKKEDLQQEILDKVKPGTKPSDLKKLKRSKSADDINIPTPPPLPIVNDQLKEKQREIENLREQLEKVNQELQTVKQELDQSLAARVAGVKVFGEEHAKRVKVEQELNETIEEASDELINQDDKVSQLRTQLAQSQHKINQLEQELKREQRKNNLHSTANFTDPLPHLDYLKYALYTLLAV